MGDVKDTLAERGTRYGDFKDQAAISQALKTVMMATAGWAKLLPFQKEALEIIQHKVARILNGDPNYGDSWHDIAGYAVLVEQEILCINALAKDVGCAVASPIESCRQCGCVILPNSGDFCCVMCHRAWHLKHGTREMKEHLKSTL